MIIDKIPTYEELDKQLTDWTTKTFGEKFFFRKYQKEVAIDVILSFFNNTKYYIAECPTGFGKSFMAFAIAGVLSEYYDLKGYILCSDLSLTKQYYDDLRKYLPNWGDLMGQQNYLCSVNGFMFNLGACKLQGTTSYAEIKEHYPCAKTCQYLVEHEKAVNAPVTVCTYQNWLLQQNYVKRQLGLKAPFDSRDFVICDEAHNLVSIVQSHFSPRFGKEDEKKIGTIIDEYYFSKNKKQLKDDIHKVRELIFKENDNDKIKIHLETYFSLIHPLSTIAESVKLEIGQKIKGGGSLTKKDKSILYDCEFIKDHNCKFEDYLEIIEQAGSKYIVKNDTAEEGVIVFNCINESYLLGKAFHNHVKNGLFMSATIGDPNAFAKECNIKKNNYRFAIVPSTFDFTKSPIYYIDTYKLNYNNRDYVFDNVLKITEKILEKYPNQQGIIQTGNYDFANRIYERINPKFKSRIIKYDNAQMKQDVLYDFKEGCTDKVLIGPSLLEGLDLKDDICRFQIIFKIPYPSLSDKFTKAKMNFDNEWYSNKTIISILQGVGRSIRNENDYATTYIIDGCFDRLLYGNRNMFNEDFLNRIKKINEFNI